jgi:hypothetical protein
MLSGTRFTLIAAVASILGVGALLITAATGGRAGGVERTDFDVVRTATTPAFDARLAPAADAGIKEFRIPMTHETIEIAKGVIYTGWTFGDTVAGAVIGVSQGELVRISLVNMAKDMPHSIDFHA